MGAILREGFEAGDSAADGWESFSSGGLLDEVTTGSGITASRKDINGHGGSYYATYNSASSTDNTVRDMVKPLKRQAREIFLKFAFAASTTERIRLVYPCFLQASGSTQCSLYFGNDITTLRFYRGTGSLQGETPVGFFSTDSQWRVALVHIFIDDSNGFCKIYRDYDFTTPFLNVSGIDTKQSSTFNYADSWVISCIGRYLGDFRIAYDDLAANDITMTYSSGSGTLPSVGDTILGQTSGARAIITALLPGSTAASGTLQLRSVQDSGLVDWSGIQADDPFSTETIDDSLSSNLWSANITGLDKNSGFPTNGYIIALQPNADVAGKIQLSNTGAGDNYEDVDDIPPDTANYVFTSTSGDRDIYEVENLATAGLSPGDISEISTVTLKTLWQKSDATLNTGKLIVEHSGVEYDSEAKSPPLGGFDGAEEIYDKIPDGTPSTSTDWNATNVDSLRIGVKFET